MLPLQSFEIFMILANPMEFVTAVFWSLDVLASLFTSTYRNGVLETDIYNVWRTYSRTWMFFDIPMITLDWIMIGTKYAGDADGSMSFLKIMRVIRFARLLRLMKMFSVLSKLLRRVNNVNILVFLHILKYTIGLVLLNHILAGLWYTLGESTAEGWVDKFVENERTSVYRYFTALHWSLSQFHGSNDIYPNTTFERAVACCSVLLGLVTTAAFLSNLTNSMIMLQTLHAEHIAHQHSLCNYLREHKISGPLCSRAKNFLENHIMASVREEEQTKTLMLLPLDMLMDLHDEARTPHTVGNVFFAELHDTNPRAVRHISHEAMEEVEMPENQTVFFQGDACSRVLILVQGALQYGIQRLSLLEQPHAMSHEDLIDEQSMLTQEDIRDNRWISEPVLWTHWECAGSLVTSQNSELIAIDEHQFAQVMRKYQMAYLLAVRYAKRFIEMYNDMMEQPSDLLNLGVRSSMSNQTGDSSHSMPLHTSRYSVMQRLWQPFRGFTMSKEFSVGSSQI